nr:DUF1800 domain-containing protein [uncultured Sphingorhabdus sp.]
MMTNAAIAMNRFGLGARPSASLPVSPTDWLKSQIGKYDPALSASADQPSRASIAASFRDYQLDSKDRQVTGKDAAAIMPGDSMTQIDPAKIEKVVNTLRLQYVAAVDARMDAAITSDTDFAERLVHFWSNHFAVSIDKLPVLALAGDYEFTAIRPNIMGKFSDLLLAAVTHPAMLLYLDQAQSIGPNSSLATQVAARRKRILGLNENLAREILELHTLGARTVYDQSDVTEFARALTGFTVGGMSKGPIQRLMAQNGKDGDSQFFAAIHEPGDRNVIGRRYGQQGAAQARAILSDIATHPATAKHIATKLAQHFAADVPPPSLIARLEKSFLESGGDLPKLYRTLIDSPEMWQAKQAKFKSPWDWVISSLRALNVRELPNNRQSANMLAQMGQPVWKPGSPAGFSDMTENWAGGAALMRRVEIASRIAERSANRVDARTLAPRILSTQLSTMTAESIARAESPSQGLALLLLSPEFLRR